jgi:deoxyribodipyrimidine photo-lyase
MDHVNIFWFRRDLRLDDNAGLYHALKSGKPVLPVFIFDKKILSDLADKKDARVSFIYDCVQALQFKLETWGSTLQVFYDEPLTAFKKLIETYSIGGVYTNEDYEPYARQRDASVAKLLEKSGASFRFYKDQVIFSKDEILKDDGKPYTVYTPYAKRWRATLKEFHLKSYPISKYKKNFYQRNPHHIPSLESMGFGRSDLEIPSAAIHESLIRNYAKTRDYPGVEGTSHLGIHLRFGTISIRKLATKAQQWSEVYLRELIWREFYSMILWQFPEVGEGKAFKPAYDLIKWRHDEKDFRKWCEGNTGYPIVDAGMRELNTTGYMHNRVRMIVASFLCKHLLIDWRWGEAYFAEKLLDYDLMNNNGGWQWCAGSGCDAAPYFRIFNPELQTKKFDPQLTYIRKWVPEFEELTYPQPMVDHKFARERCLKAYKEALA